MKSIIEAVEGFFQREGLGYESTEFVGVFKTGFVGENGCFRGYVDVDEERRSIVVRTFAPVQCSKSKRPQIAELLTRINQQLLLGNFELSMDSGTIAFRASIVLGESDLHPEVMKYLLHTNWCALDTFFPAINAVLFAGVSPKDAISKKRRESRRNATDKAKPDAPCSGRLRDIMGGSTN